MPVVFIGIGSNLGDRAGNINRAITCLAEDKKIAVIKVSPLVETVPFKAFGPKYLNGVVKAKTDLSPKNLLAVLQKCELQMRRVRLFKNSPRTIDLDIILYGDFIIDEPDLKIPHPKMFERDFVVKPLLELAPELKNKFPALKNS